MKKKFIRVLFLEKNNMFENEKVIETKQCKHCSCNFEITDKDLDFYEKVSPIFQDIKFSIPTPNLCPDCRQQRRLSFRNERKLYKRTCDASGRSIVSIYSPDKPYKVYDQEIWWSDKWDPMDYGIDFDFNRSFFEQFDELMKEVPLLGLIVTPSVENSPYTNYTDSSKNIYMCSDVFHCDAVYYSSTIKNLENCIDCLDLQKSNNVYEATYSQSINNSSYINYCNNCSESIFLNNCINTDKSLFSVGLINKKYYLLNKPISIEKYEELIKKDIIKLIKLYGDEFKKLNLETVKKENLNVSCENCLGDNLVNCSNSKFTFDATNVKNSKYVIVGYDMENVMDTNIHNIDCFYDYEAISGGKLVNSAFNILGWGGFHLYYSFLCFDSSNFFGCIGLKNKSYCILNKQYTKEEYEILVPKIIEHMQKTGEWGEFFPSSISPFGYNETVANEYFPLSRDVALQHLYKWSDYEPPFPKVEKIIKATMLPENISDIPDDILNWAIECEVTKKPFRIIKQELEFYRKHNLPIPRRHPDQRHLDRMSLRNPRKLFDRKCDKCGIDMKTTHSPEREEIVYCENCYNKEVY